ncbi:unnamed protein product [Toxocara canis]|uniref:Movement protein n=1 Tax=Toxocara canis TaxID=6265 RepID=A0A183VEG5_TOXCA|nr:unnamed protein product [Toxocara canis]
MFSSPKRRIAPNGGKIDLDFLPERPVSKSTETTGITFEGARSEKYGFGDYVRQNSRIAILGKDGSKICRISSCAPGEALKTSAALTSPILVSVEEICGNAPIENIRINMWLFEDDEVATATMLTLARRWTHFHPSDPAAPGPSLSMRVPEFGASPRGNVCETVSTRNNLDSTRDLCQLSFPGILKVTKEEDKMNKGYCTVEVVAVEKKKQEMWKQLNKERGGKRNKKTVNCGICCSSSFKGRTLNASEVVSNLVAVVIPREEQFHELADGTIVDCEGHVINLNMQKPTTPSHDNDRKVDCSEGGTSTNEEDLWALGCSSESLASNVGGPTNDREFLEPLVSFEEFVANIRCGRSQLASARLVGEYMTNRPI